MSGYTFSTEYIFIQAKLELRRFRREFDFLKLAFRNLYKIETQPASTQRRYTCTCARVCVYIYVQIPVLEDRTIYEY